MKPSLPSYVLAFLSLLQTCHVYVLWPCEDTDGTCRGKEECIADGKGPLKFVREKRSCPPGLFCCQPPYNEDPCESELQGVCYDHQRCIDAGRTPVLKTPKGASGCPSQPKNIICCVSACGLPHFDPRMSSFGNTRGQHVVPHSWPWHVLLDEPPFHRCGGALITKQSVLTAAHCLQSNFATFNGSAFVKLGKHHSEAEDRGEQLIPIKYPIIIHPGYRSTSDPESTEFDLAIVNLARPAILSDSVKLVCLPNPTDTVAVGDHCYATGWGFDKASSQTFSLTLRQALLPIVNWTKCARNLEETGVLHSSMICAGGVKRLPNMCRGDSGAPLVCRNPKGIWRLFGILSWGVKECLKNARHKPDVFSYVPGVRDWILNNAIKHK